MDSDALSFLQPLLAWITIHPTWAGLAVFFTALSESLAFVGIIFPGAMMMFGFGAVIATGAMAFLPTLIWAILGAIAGDGLSFWVGHYFRDRLRTMWPFSRHPEMLEKGIEFFQHHGGKSILFGRFVGPIRPIIPVVAGMMGMPAARFVGVNVLSALVWGPAYLLPGMVFGASLSLAAEVASRLVIVLAGLVGAVWLTFFVVHRFLGGFVGAVVLALVVTGTWYITGSHEADLKRYTQSYTPRLLSAESWWTEGWRELPALRSDLRDRPRQPLDLQWAGPLEDLQARLITAGWQTHPALSATNLLRLLAPHPTEAELPLTPQFLDGHLEALRLVHKGGNEKGNASEGTSQWLVIRLWTSGVHLTPGDTPLWVGYVSYLEPWRFVPWITVLRTGSSFGKTQAALENSLAGLDLRTVHRPSSPDLLGDGGVLLVRTR